MAQRTTIMLTDDLDGTDADETVTFALDGTSYEIDLNSEHAADLREALAIYVQAGRRSGGPARRRGAPRRAAAAVASDNEPTAAAIRAWARDTGAIEVSSRGRVAPAAREAYLAAHA